MANIFNSTTDEVTNAQAVRDILKTVQRYETEEAPDDGSARINIVTSAVFSPEQGQET